MENKILTLSTIIPPSGGITNRSEKNRLFDFSRCGAFFFTLVHFEYRKIFKRKSTYISFFMIFIVIMVSVFGMLLGPGYVIDGKKTSNYEEMEKDRKYGRGMKGYIDESKITEIIEKINILTSDENNFEIDSQGEMFLKKEIREKYIRPYGDIIRIMNVIYAPEGKNQDSYAIYRLSVDDAKLFYENRTKKINEMLNFAGEFTDAEIENYNKLNSQIKIPYYYDHFEGYTKIVHYTATTAIFIALGIAICIAPIFSGEYSGLTDQIILTSKYGKNKAIAAKIFTGISFSAIVSAVSLTISAITLLVFYGFDGAGVSFQVLYPLIPYPISMFQASIITLLVAMSGIMLVSVIILLLSSKFKTSFAVIIASNLILFAPMFMRTPYSNRFLSTIIRLFPSKMFEASNIFSEYFFCLGDIAVIPYIFMPVFCMIFIFILIPFIYRAFKVHQIN